MPRSIDSDRQSAARLDAHAHAQSIELFKFWDTVQPELSVHIIYIHKNQYETLQGWGMANLKYCTAAPYRKDCTEMTHDVKKLPFART